MLKDLQHALVRALTSNTPLETLRRERASLPEADQAAIDSINREHFLLSSLLVRKLRFERICRGDTAAEEWFAREPERFTEAFQAYNAAVPPVEFFPRPEALAFREWCRANGFANPGPSGGVQS